MLSILSISSTLFLSFGLLFIGFILQIVAMLLVPPAFLFLAIAVRIFFTGTGKAWVMGGVGLLLLIIAWFLYDLGG